MAPTDFLRRRLCIGRARPDGTHVLVHHSMSVLRDAAGDPSGVMAVTLDFSVVAGRFPDGPRVGAQVGVSVDF